MDSSIVSLTSKANRSKRFLGLDEFAGRLRRSGTAAVEAGLTSIVYD